MADLENDIRRYLETIPDYDIRFRNIIDSLLIALKQYNNNTIDDSYLRHIFEDGKQAVERLHRVEQEMKPREQVQRFIQDRLNERSYSLMVQQLSYEVGQFDRGIITEEVLQQTLNRAEREYMSTLDNI